MRLTVGKKLLLSFGAIVAVMALSTLVSWIHLSDLGTAQKDLFDKRMPIRETFATLQLDERQLVSDLRGYVLTDPGSSQRLALGAALHVEMSEAQQAASRLHDLSGTFSRKETKDQAANTENGVLSICQTGDSILRLVDSGKRDNRRQAAQLLQEQVLPQALLVEQNAGTAVHIGGQMMQNVSTKIVTDTNSALWVLLLAGSVVLLFGVVVGTWLSRQIVHAIRILLDRANAIAAADLSGGELQATTHDEFAELTLAINQMQSHLSELLESISEKASAVAAATGQISEATAQSARGAKAQETQTSQTATAMQEMAASVAEVSQNSSQAADAARQAAEAARKGGAVVEQTVATMRAIADNTTQVATQIQELGQRSDQIGKIVSVIDEIAEQTNLLALNAAIEAARAGEQGRGFAVVAGEVRRLAERTAGATREIGATIAGIQEETLRAVHSIGQGAQEAQQGVNAAAQAGAALSEIITTAEGVGEMILQIATAATEQSAATEEVTRTIEEIARVTGESTGSIQQTATTCEELSGLAAQLRQLVSRFHVERGADHGLSPSSRSSFGEDRASAASPSAVAGRAFAR
jgi:methyl-accepting chemotaxis protein